MSLQCYKLIRLSTAVVTALDFFLMLLGVITCIIVGGEFIELSIELGFGLLIWLLWFSACLIHNQPCLACSSVFGLVWFIVLVIISEHRQRIRDTKLVYYVGALLSVTELLTIMLSIGISRGCNKINQLEEQRKTSMRSDRSDGSVSLDVPTSNQAGSPVIAKSIKSRPPVAPFKSLSPAQRPTATQFSTKQTVAKSRPSNSPVATNYSLTRKTLPDRMESISRMYRSRPTKTTENGSDSTAVTMRKPVISVSRM